MTVIAIDPGNTESAYVRIGDDYRPMQFGKVPNDELRFWLSEATAKIPARCATWAIEMVASYGMAVGADVFETCVWTGRFAEIIDRSGGAARLVVRSEVKMNLCHNTRAKDSNITQALIDRFGAGASNKGKGTKANPGWFYGFAGDVWQAYALAVTVADQQQGGVW